jgi:hypothetical protein
MQPAILRNEPTAGRKFVHHVVADAARGIAGEFWEQMATGKRYRGKVHPKAKKAADDFYKAWPDQQLFIDARWHEFKETATQALTVLLGRPDLAESVKADIHEALRLNGLVQPRRLSPEAQAGQTIQDLMTKR